MSRFQWITLLVFLLIGGSFVAFTQKTHLEREARKRAEREASALATAEQLRRQVEEPALPFEVEESRLVPEGDRHWLLELDVLFRNESDRELVLEGPDAGVFTESGEPVAEFFLAFAQTPTIKPRSEERVQLRYWLEKSQRESGLYLEIEGDRLALEL